MHKIQLHSYHYIKKNNNTFSTEMKFLPLLAQKTTPFKTKKKRKK